MCLVILGLSMFRYSLWMSSIVWQSGRIWMMGCSVCGQVDSGKNVVENRNIGSMMRLSRLKFCQDCIYVVVVILIVVKVSLMSSVVGSVSSVYYDCSSLFIVIMSMNIVVQSLLCSCVQVILLIVMLCGLSGVVRMLLQSWVYFSLKNMLNVESKMVLFIVDEVSIVGVTNMVQGIWMSLVSMLLISALSFILSENRQKIGLMKLLMSSSQLCWYIWVLCSMSIWVILVLVGIGMVWVSVCSRLLGVWVVVVIG